MSAAEGLTSCTEIYGKMSHSYKVHSHIQEKKIIEISYESDFLSFKAVIIKPIDSKA